MQTGASPLRLIDTLRSREVWLLQMPTVRPIFGEGGGNEVSALSGGEREPDTSKKRQLNAWRCDMHPSWSRDFKWIAFNGRPHHGLRQVPSFYTIYTIRPSFHLSLCNNIIQVLVAHLPGDDATLEKMFAGAGTDSADPVSVR